MYVRFLGQSQAAHNKPVGSTINVERGTGTWRTHRKKYIYQVYIYIYTVPGSYSAWLGGIVCRSSSELPIGFIAIGSK